MTSQINSIATVDVLYPVAGQDNDSQGFRDNFKSIDDKFSQADLEITALQLNAVQVDKEENSLEGTVLHDGAFYGFHGTALLDASPDADVLPENGPLQTFVFENNSNLRFRNWYQYPTQYASVRVHIIGRKVGDTITPTLTTERGGEFIYESRFTAEVDLVVDENKQKVIDVWTADGGLTYFVNYVGEFDAPAS